MLLLNCIDFYVSVCRKDNKECGDKPLKKQNGFIDHKADGPDAMENIRMTTEGLLNGNVKNNNH